MINTNNTSKKNKILIAAADIVIKQGVACLTLEAVANKAGVSKGGLLYHFPNKEALIKGMVDELTHTYTKNINKYMLMDNEDTGKWIRAFVNTTFNAQQDEFERSSALLGAVFTNPELLEKLQMFYKDMQKQFENDGVDPIRSIIVRLATDGLWLAELFGLAPLDKTMKERIYSELISMLREGEESENISSV
ncbi:TetR/AcrR family transcriptional regulator [Desulforamulus aeronauticus]|uniref:Transcriptional regulator, TetR family n=1 Tax=Desulforamulus aeronauticus DSM 10349 TaxID=1121421 RepID=A0A1M6QCK1_9FIRM|nr:TetR/AcrR family transcriptional regulator [Desulforamulus aeronauticus]SHK17896.1 transcriptional regulator, TetR family [Desulforamulus aeronauticus DSM 10349]